ncbi:MAG: hypothetical protein CO128_00580, partial [Ignavibacteriales bacterium CG_4_9_14_3_um_filter_30_11]
MKIANKIFIVFFILSGIIVTNAQDKMTLDLEQSIQLGLKNNSALHGSKMNMALYEAKLNEAKTYFLPTLNFNASYTRLSEIDPFEIITPFGKFNISPTFFNQYNFKLSLQQPVFTGFKLTSSKNIAEYYSMASKEDYTKAEKDLIFNIKNAYWNLFKANQMQKVIEENINQINSHLNDIKNLFDQGMATNNDVLKVQVQLADVTLKQIDITNAVQIATVALNNLIGIPLSTEVSISEQVVNDEIEMESLAVLMESAYKNRADLKSMNYKVEASNEGIDLAKSDWFPQIYISGNYYYSNPNQRILPSVDKFNGTWDVSLSLSLNLWNWGATNDRKTQAEMQYKQAQDYYSTLKDAVKLDITSSYLNLKKSEQKIIVAENSVKEAEENYRVTKDKFN